MDPVEQWLVHCKLEVCSTDNQNRLKAHALDLLRLLYLFLYRREVSMWTPVSSCCGSFSAVRGMILEPEGVLPPGQLEQTQDSCFNLNYITLFILVLQGSEYVPPVSGCCGTCRAVACSLENGRLLHPGQSEQSQDLCSTLTCTLLNNEVGEQTVALKSFIGTDNNIKITTKIRIKSINGNY